ncbi:unnamed protein product [Tilletia controversa]|uniref:Uncharacterized protein n=3 Tax=Tilletia TaxID=13289 RepID=A0A8X7MUN3_9BASI|nr:hypothetical protein CF336_g3835 [Tilletia laevis]KAE8201008.1 hypothetical protein CF328_g2799 [Tilletia controversa]KAE8259709.1 hypothetical protein A4X03_0g4018 [Tilletia caries]KAE8203395.1 hypothetical protein CF335_g3036 [Tilletia laevis]KAE8249067.1 hypothetical protein A4X06_0g3404 [Tilletia controversa]
MTSADSALALELRLRLLETILSGPSEQAYDPTESRLSSSSHHQQQQVPSSRTLTVRTARATNVLHSTVKENASLAAFVRAYDKNLPFLTPAFALAQPGSNPVEEDLRLSGVDPSSSTPSAPESNGKKSESEAEQSETENIPLSALALQPQAQAALLLEVEPELQALERQLAECKVLDERDTAGAGTLAETETLAPKLKAAWEQHAKRKAEVESLERQLSTVFDSYTDYTDAASQIFIAWDELLTSMELRVSKAEKDRVQQV